MRTPYRPPHAVWIDVFGVVLLGALLAGGGGYLLTQAGHIPPRLRDSSGQEDARSAERHLRSPVSASRERVPHTGERELVGGRAEPTGETVSVPFSASWRRNAVPELGGPSSSSGGAPRAPAGRGLQDDGPAIASARSGRPPGAAGSPRETSSRSTGARWRAEARRLGGEARALSNALGRLDRAATDGAERRASSEANQPGGTAGGTPEAAGAPGLPNDPDPVPIGDHLHWLAVAGLLWGAWRLGRGA